MTAVAGREYEVLLVDDDDADIALITEAFATHHARVRLHTAGDGVEALAFLRREGDHSGANRPDLILLDLNMPRMDGREVLAVVKSDPDLGAIPVVVFTTSDRAEDVTASYTRHANAYVTKPLDLDELDAVIAKIYDFYGHLVTRPR
ncbi:MAG TPA: response regulator [Actinoplanes sp.]|jgi:CheY-like chemotaxis protein